MTRCISSVNLDYEALLDTVRPVQTQERDNTFDLVVSTPAPLLSSKLDQSESDSIAFINQG